ncbi:hypothetical protein RchiOBHm_Chr1g0364221 [Rosa chinensis]|uniref:Uncharacterized protein n=1 Tax=Rosa chinensis TaxID=74649 RepID=A0A2P6SJN8_ROSCH|nr:hypothetical protein RchiOBHm_Chr1g0364221 [Rosa chinensis]
MPSSTLSSLSLLSDQSLSLSGSVKSKTPSVYPPPSLSSPSPPPCSSSSPPTRPDPTRRRSSPWTSLASSSFGSQMRQTIASSAASTRLRTRGPNPTRTAAPFCITDSTHSSRHFSLGLRRPPALHLFLVEQLLMECRLIRITSLPRWNYSIYIFHN